MARILTQVGIIWRPDHSGNGCKIKQGSQAPLFNYRVTFRTTLEDGMNLS